MINRLEIENFKALNHFEIELGKFNCLVGLNGSGKSTLLDALYFLGDALGGMRTTGVEYTRLRNVNTTVKAISGNDSVVVREAGVVSYEVVGNMAPLDVCDIDSTVTHTLLYPESIAGCLEEISGRLKTIYPNVIDLEISNSTLYLKEKVGEKNVKYRLKREEHYTLLKFIAIFILEQINCIMVLDNAELGVDSARIEAFMDTLVHSKNQVVITTHSPVLINYLDDDVAKESVILMNKRRGIVKAKRLFDVPMIEEKLTVMGPGEAYADTHIEDIKL